MPKSFVSADVVFPRVCELLGDTELDLRRVPLPVPRVCYPRETGLDQVMVLWEVERPEFVIDEADLPY